MSLRWCSAVCMCVLGACSGASPDPRKVAAEELPNREISAAAADQIAKLTADAHLALIARRFGTAEEQARQAIDLDPRAARARAILGVCLLQRAKTATPPDLFLQNQGDGETLRALRLMPQDPIVGRLRGEFLASIGHLSAAAATAEDVLAAAADDGSRERTALLGLAAEWRYELGEERAALPHLQRLVELLPDDAAAHFRLGYCLLRTATTATVAIHAAAAFQRCADLSPGDLDAWLAAGRAHLQAAAMTAETGAVREQQRTAALAAFATAAERFPAAAEPLFCRGSTLASGGDGSGAEAAFRAALVKDPNHVAALLELANLCAANTDPTLRAEAAPLLRRALAVAEARPGTLSPRERERIQAFLAPEATAVKPSADSTAPRK